MKKLFTQIQVMLIAVCCATITHAQDPHFSQYLNLPLFLNPAHAGNGIEHMRATIVYRNQWGSVAAPFTTQGFLIDKKVNRFGFGFHVIKNGAGSAGMNQINLAGTMGYNLPVSKNSTLSGAFQVGMINKSFNPSNLTFDNQYVEDVGYDAGASSGEVFTNTSITRPDVSFGMMYQRGFGKSKIKFKPFGGISLSHINNPKETFIIDHNTLPVRQTYHFGAGIMIKENVELKPSCVIMLQDHFNEVYVGSLISFMLKNTNKFQTGVFMRNKDAMILYAGYQVNQLFIGTSYDINTSSLKKASGSNGGFELTLSYIPKSKKKAKVEDLKEVVVKKSTKREKLVKTDKKTVSEIKNPVQVPEQLQPVVKTTESKTQVQTIQPTTNENVAKVEEKIITGVEKTQPPTPEKIIVPESKAPVNQPVNPALGEKENTEPVAIKEVTVIKQEKVNTPSAITLPENKKVVSQPVNTSLGEKEITEPKTMPVVNEVIAAKSKVSDTDGDGITDTEDECPYSKGTAAARGCPDSDSDGLIDTKDHCPMEPGKLENNGCPSHPLSFEKSNLIQNFNNIEFETGQARVKTADVFDIVERSIDIMYEFPDSKVILTGHTDNEGDELFNMTLSRARTEVIKKYMMQQGIDESRIQTIEFGETKPLVNNSTAFGKARNRRVEINIIK